MTEIEYVALVAIPVLLVLAIVLLVFAAALMAAFRRKT